MPYLDPASWRAATRNEVMEAISSRPKNATRAKNRPRRGSRVKPRGLLIFQSLLNPLDVYSYLRARFGEPNGLQSMMIQIGMVQEDSSNMIQWDYMLKCEEGTLTITGAGREVHVMVDHDMTDCEWIQFSQKLKADFSNYGGAKSEIVKNLEKWYVFPNRYKAIADRCAELQDDLSAVMKQLQEGLPARPKGRNKRDFEHWGKLRGRLTNTIVATCVQLSVLTPVMFESFVGLITAVLLRPEVRSNRRLRETFQRSALDVKIYDLSTRCVGFARPIIESNEVMQRYWKVVNERNDVLHGNIDPVKDHLEIVYFKGRMPIFSRGGDVLDEYFTALIKQYKPAKVLENYHLAHEMIVEILSHMVEPTKFSVVGLMQDNQPGWDDRRNKVGWLFPDYVASFHLEGSRYDRELIEGLA